MQFSKGMAIGCLAVALLAPICASADIVTITASGKITQITPFELGSGDVGAATSSFGIDSPLSWTVTFDTSSPSPNHICAPVLTCSVYTILSSDLHLGSYEDTAANNSAISWNYWAQDVSATMSIGSGYTGGPLLPSSSEPGGYAPVSSTASLFVSVPFDGSYPTGAQWSDLINHDVISTVANFQFENASGEGLLATTTYISYSASYTPSPVPLPPAVYLFASALAVLMGIRFQWARTVGAPK